LAAQWHFVRPHLPAPPSRVLEIGCGPVGGFVPALLESGYAALGVDPAAPDGDSYRQVPFEEHDDSGHLDAVVACTSLHHVDDLDEVVRRIAARLAPGGAAIVIEWASERFDEPTAEWCFARLGPEPGESDGDGNGDAWLRRHRDGWQASGESWEPYFTGWVQEHGLHRGRDIVAALDDRLERRVVTEGPYVFADLDHTTEADEQAAIDAGAIQPTGIRYVGIRR
jgi:SAM-dependent methyltransferase